MGFWAGDSAVRHPRRTQQASELTDAMASVSRERFSWLTPLEWLETAELESEEKGVSVQMRRCHMKFGAMACTDLLPLSHGRTENAVGHDGDPICLFMDTKRQ